MPEHIYTIYKLQNKINGKIYIGFTGKLVEERWAEHCKDAKSGSDFAIHRAIRKYGFENFVGEILYQSSYRKHCLTEMEPYFIREYKSYVTFENGYNMTIGGDGTQQHEVPIKTQFQQMLYTFTYLETAEYYGVSKKTIVSWKKILGVENKGYNRSETSKCRRKQCQKGFVHTEETKQKMSASAKGKPKGPMSFESKQKLSKSKSFTVPDKGQLSDMLKIFTKAETAVYYKVSYMTVTRWYKMLFKNWSRR